MGASDDMTSRENQIASDSQSAVYMVYILAISVLSLVFLAAGVILDGNSDVASILNVADTALCALFFIDFVITLTRSKSKRQYLATWGWLDLVSSLPMVPALRIGRLARVVRVVRVLRGIRSVRVLSSFFLERRAQNTVVAAVLVTILLMVFGSIAILSFETGPDANIKGPEDALWWSAVTLTTVGYGDRFPVTTEGRAVAVLLMVAGVGLFGALSGFIASWFLTPSGQHQDDEISQLRSEIGAIREMLVEQQASESGRGEGNA
jgi:voltage-gated potassium channel